VVATGQQRSAAIHRGGNASFSEWRRTPALHDGGASWEGFAIEEVLRVTGDRDAWIWSTQGVPSWSC
jgi:hypothetical protein